MVYLWYMVYKSLTFTVNSVITREHDPTTHNVSFKATWTKGITNTTALEQLPVIYRTQES